MKYVVMIFRNVDRAWTAEDDEGLARLMKLERELTASGELISSEGLLPPGQGQIVQVRNGTQVVTDGPFGESKEQLAGFFMVEVADDDRAQAVAGLVSAAVDDRVELRETVL